MKCWLGFEIRNYAIIVQNLLCSWLTNLYKLKMPQQEIVMVGPIWVI